MTIVYCNFNIVLKWSFVCWCSVWFEHQLVTDPIFIAIEQLEQDKDGNPKEMSLVIKEMKAGNTGSMTIPRARKAKGKVWPCDFCLPTILFLALSAQEVFHFKQFSFANSSAEYWKILRLLDRVVCKLQCLFAKENSIYMEPHVEWKRTGGSKLLAWCLGQWRTPLRKEDCTIGVMILKNGVCIEATRGVATRGYICI